MQITSIQWIGTITYRPNKVRHRSKDLKLQEEDEDNEQLGVQCVCVCLGARVHRVPSH